MWNRPAGCNTCRAIAQKERQLKDPFSEDSKHLTPQQIPQDDKKRSRPIPDSFDLLFILWNEAKTIEGVIKSFWDNNNKPLYKNLFIGIDAKTSDHTREIIKPFSDHVIEFDFLDDFSKARNLVIKYFEESSTSEWAIMPDGHEFLAKESRDLLKLVMLDGKNSFRETKLIVPYFGMFEDMYCCDQMCCKIDLPEFVFQRPIMFKRGKEMKFNKAVHNFMNAPYPYKQVLPSLNLEHRMPPDRQEKRVVQRKDMNITGLQKNYKKNKKDTHALFYLAQTHADQGDSKEAIKWYKRHIRVCEDDDERAESRLTCGVLLNNLKKHKEAKEIIVPALSTQPGWKRGEMYFQLGKAAFMLEKYEEAVHWFTICADMQIPITTFFIRPLWYGLDCYDALLDCHFKLGNYREALQWAYKSRNIKKNCKSAERNVKTLEDIISRGDKEVVESQEIFQTMDISING